MLDNDVDADNKYAPATIEHKASLLEFIETALYSYFVYDPSPVKKDVVIWLTKNQQCEVLMHLDWKTFKDNCGKNSEYRAQINGLAANLLHRLNDFRTTSKIRAYKLFERYIAIMRDEHVMMRILIFQLSE